jgi:hypothetical protein
VVTDREAGVVAGPHGDHMHMFQAGRRRYSSGSFGMEETGDSG